MEAVTFVLASYRIRTRLCGGQDESTQSIRLDHSWLAAQSIRYLFKCTALL